MTQVLPVSCVPPVMGDANSNDVDHSSLEPTFQSVVSRKDKLFKIIVVGNPMVGKSSFIFRYVHGRFNARFKPTIGGKDHVRRILSLKV